MLDVLVNVWHQPGRKRLTSPIILTVRIGFTINSVVDFKQLNLLSNIRRFILSNIQIYINMYKHSGSYHFLPGDGGPSVCDRGSAIFSGPPFACAKNSGPPSPCAKKFWSLPWPTQKIMVPLHSDNEIIN